MKPIETEALTIVVEDSFCIQGRGWVLAPALAMDQFPANGRLAINVVEPSGTTRSLSGRFMVEHIRLVDGRSKWDGVIVIDEGAGKVPPGSRLTCRLDDSQVQMFAGVRLRNGIGCIDGGGAVHMPPDGAEFGIAETAGTVDKTVPFYIVELPALVAVIQNGGKPLIHSEREMEAAQRLLSAGIPVVAWIGPDAEGCAIIDCYSSAPLAMESAACGAWALKALGGWDASARMTFYVTHIADCERDESTASVHTYASAWLSAVGGRSTGAWSVEIRRARCGFNALHELIRRQGSCALIAVDVDWAIYFNDAYGHHEGDLILARVHTAIEQLAEEHGGHFVRTGGDDFAIVLPENTSSGPMACAESIRASVHDLNIPFHHPAVRTHGRVTVSVCVLRRRTSPATATELREAVEGAIYEAKRLGKNNVRDARSRLDSPE